MTQPATQGDALWPPAPAAFVDGPPAVVAETHVSVIVLVGDRAVKLKKPVVLPYLDWSDRAAREAVCHREVELNRRLAPDVYLGVADVSDKDGRPCEHLVVMRRMPDERRLRRLVTEGAELHQALDDLAALLARFHAAADRSPAITEAAGRDTVRRNWDDNLRSLRAVAGTVLDAAVVARVDELAHAYLLGRGSLFAERGEAERAVDGHGDLLADDIYLLDDGPRVLDCLEFSDTLRAVDVLDDAAFLAMDLERLGAPDLGDWFLDAYTRHAGDTHPASLAHHYVAYRAGVRAKVACIRAQQGHAPAGAQARALLDLARRHLEAARVRLVLVGGLPGTGKSTLAARLAGRLRWPLLRSDAVRKELAGIAPATPMAAPYGEGLYAPDQTRAAYAELLARARHLLDRGESVVLDASWTDTARRAEAAEVAGATASELVALCCVAPAELTADRLARRPPEDASDATPAVAAAMATHADAWPEAITVATTGTPEETEALALRALALDDPAGS